MALEGGVALGLAATTAGCVLDIGLDIVIAELKYDTGAKGRVLVVSAGDGCVRERIAAIPELPCKDY
jgi:hypothetical protein